MRIQKPKPGKLPKWVKIAIYLIVAIVVVGGELKDVGILPSGSERDYSAVEEYADKPYVEMNGNKPEFDELTTKCFEEYSKLDSLGRCGVAYACALMSMCTTHSRELQLIIRTATAV